MDRWLSGIESATRLACYPIPNASRPFASPRVQLSAQGVRNLPTWVGARPIPAGQPSSRVCQQAEEKGVPTLPNLHGLFPAAKSK